MLKSFVDKILSLGEIEKLELSGRPYTSKETYPVLDPEPGIIEIDTLTGLLGYLKANIDKLEPEKLMIHVDEFKTVYLMSALHGEFKQRTYHMKAVFPEVKQHFGQFLDTENMVIWLQTGFLQDMNRDAVIAVIGNIKDEAVNNFNDDGMTQQVTAKRGVVKVENIPVPNPVILRPYRTFLEIQQPVSPFVLRMRSGGGQGPVTGALFEADGGFWKLEATRLIKEYLEAKLQEMSINIPVIA